MLGTFVFCAAAVSGCGSGSSKCCPPFDAASTEDAASSRDANDEGAGFRCTEWTSLNTYCQPSPSGSSCVLTWDGLATDPTYCRNGTPTTQWLGAETCGDYRIFENRMPGDVQYFYYYDASGALVAIVTLSAGDYQCLLGLPAVIEPPCEAGSRLPVCPADAGTGD